MRCPNCQYENPDKAKFCLECGAKLAIPLALTCSQCGLELPPGAKFCLECGTPVKAGAAPPSVSPEQQVAERLKRLVPKEYAERLLANSGALAGERRTVSILFCDVKGSTAMAQNLDPEDVLEVMNGAFEALIPPIYRHEGTLARLMGDAILAFFGAPIAHEDDAERACRAGLEILAGARRYAEELVKTRALAGFDVRVGINTGLVVMGEVGSDLRVEYTAMGDAINLAARMEQNAEPGTVLVSEDTYHRVHHSFETLPLPAILVKGHREPVSVYRILRAKKRGFRNLARGVEGIQTRMVGREAELKALQDAFFAVDEDNERLAVTILGEPGIGKSRLLQEFETWLQSLETPLHIWRGRSRAELQSTPFALLRDLVLFSLEVSDGEPSAAVRQITQRFVKGFPQQAEARAHWIGALLGLGQPSSDHLSPNPDPKEVYDRARRYLLDLLATGNSPALILLEDIHWADDSSLDLLADLTAAGAGRSPALFIFLARPTLLERRPHWLEGLPGVQRISLRALARRDSRRLVEDILQKIPNPLPELREQIVAMAEGSPLFLEELIKVLIQEGVIICQTQAWQVNPEQMAGLRIPPSLAGILQARIDHLPIAERQAVQQAAIFGRLFWDQAMVHLAGQPLAVIAPLLQALHGRELIFQHETSQVRQANEFSFKHAALRDVAYESILKKTRRQYHAQAAAWLESLAEPEALAELIGEHYELASQAQVAVDWFGRAGEQAARRYANQEAEKAFSRALALLEAPSLTQEEASIQEKRWRLLLGREAVLHLSGQRQAQAEDLEALEALAAGDPARQAEIAIRRTFYYEETSDYPACQSAAELALEYARQANNTSLSLRAQIRLGLAYEMQGRFDESEATLLEALQMAEAQDDQTRRADCLHNLALVRYYQGDCEKAAALLEEALAITRQLSDRRSEATSLRNLTGVYHDLRSLDLAAQTGSQAVEICRLIGDRSGETVALNNLAIITHALGRLEEARLVLEQALALAQEIHSVFAEGLAVTNLALVWLDLGQPTQALEFAQQAVTIARQTEDRIGLGYALTTLGLAQEAASNPTAARQSYLEALELRRELEQPALAVDDLAGLARCALAEGDFATAESHLEQALNWVQANSLDGVEHPMRLYWTAMQVYTACGKIEAANQARQTAVQLLTSWAEVISDPEARDSYLNQMHLHRAILAD